MSATPAKSGSRLLHGAVSLRPHPGAGAGTGAQVFADLQRAGHPLRNGARWRDEGVDLSGVLAALDIRVRLAKGLRVRVPLVPQRVEARGDHEGRRLAAEVAANGRGADVGLVALAPQILLRVPENAVARNDVPVLELAM